MKPDIEDMNGSWNLNNDMDNNIHTTVVYASIGRRLKASIIDGLER